MKKVGNGFYKIIVIDYPDKRIFKKYFFDCGNIQVISVPVRQEYISDVPHHFRVRKFAERHSTVNQDLTIKKDCVALRAC